MSLLNDALRKKRSEAYATREAPPTEWSKPGFMAGPRRRWIIGLSGIVFLAAVSAAWLGLPASPVASNRTGVSSTFYRETATARADDPKDEHIADSPVAASPSSPAPAMTVAAAPAAPAVHANGAPTSALSHEPLPARQPSPDPHPIRLQDSTPQAPARTGPAPGAQASRAPRKPVPPQAMVADTAHREELRESDRLFQRACRFHRRNDLDQAIILYRAALKEDPKHAQARFNLVAAYLQTGAYTQAYRIGYKLYAEDPSNQQVMLNLALAHIGCGRDREALALLDKAAKLPDAPLFEIAFHKAVAYDHLGRRSSALACYRQAESLRPDDPGLLFNLAVAFDQQQQYGAAVSYYLKYLEHTQERDPMKTSQIRRRIRILQTYGAEEKLKE